MRGLVCLSMLLACSACDPEPDPDADADADADVCNAADLPADREGMWSYLVGGDDGQQPTDRARYRSWSLMPVLPGQPVLKDLRLDLPTHGRFVTVYTNPCAEKALKAWFQTLKKGAGEVPRFELPRGAIIVKENYGEQLEDGSFVQKAEPGVLTVAFKPAASDCTEPRKVPDGPCLGGDWVWAFYGLSVEAPGEDGTRHINALDPFVEKATDSFCVNCHNPGANTDYLRGVQRMAQRYTQSGLQRDAAAPVALEDLDPYCTDIAASVSPSVPIDVGMDPASIDDPALRQKLFDCLSWRSFIALNWQASDADAAGEPARGVADAGADFFTPAPQRDRVWETWKQTWEVFQPTNADWAPMAGEGPGAWDTPRPLPEGCEPALGDRPLVHMVSKSSTRADVVNETGQAFAGSFGTLYDRYGRLVRYQVLFNETEFDALVPTARTKGLTPAGPSGVAALPDGSIEVKASWRELCTATDGCSPGDDPGDYYTREVLVYEAGEGASTCTPRTLGLVGMHVAHKTYWAPQWIWSTFEHRRNTPTSAQAEQGEDGFAFYRPECPQPAAEKCATTPFFAPKGVADPCCPNAELNRFPDFPRAFPVAAAPTDQESYPNQLTRLAALGSSGLNEDFAAYFASKSSVWANYMLVSTQWPMNGRAPADASADAAPRAVNVGLCEAQWTLQDGTAPQLGQPGAMAPPQRSDCYTMVPSYLRNTSMESYMTTWTADEAGVHEVSNRSCMGCHASGVDFSFIWLDGVEQVVQH